MKLSHTIAALLLAPYLLHSIESVGLAAGASSSTVFAAQVVDSGQVNPLSLSIFNPMSTLLSTDINSSGIGILGGFQFTGLTTNGYAALVFPDREIIELTGMPAPGFIKSVAINSSGNGIIGGASATSGYAAFVSVNGELRVLSILPTNISLFVDINDAGTGILGGDNYVAFASSDGIVTPLPSLGDVDLNDVAINNFGIGLIGGTQNGSTDTYAALVSSPSTVTVLTTDLTGGTVNSVAINDAGLGLIGGTKTGGADAYAAHVSSTGVVTPVTVPAAGEILSVALNESGLGLIGGTQNSNADAYAAYVSSSGTVTPLSLLPVGNAAINSVAINSLGAGLIGGFQNTDDGYLALVTPTGTVMQLAVPSDIPLNSVAFALFSQVPTVGLSGNNSKFAKQINQNASELAFYFLPSALDGSLNSALQSAAPTRNALSFFAANNNLFYLNHALSNHLQNAHHFRNRETATQPLAMGQQALDFSDELTASIAVMRPRRGGAQNVQPCAQQCSPSYNCDRPYTIWGDVIGTFAHQKSQHQTGGFNPNTGAVLVGFDATLNDTTWVGGGAAYSYTHIHEHQHAGHSNINQEYLFAYTTYAPSKFYLDAALWAGFFQTSQVRHIRMTGFEFNAKSDPHGWQLAPHLELGYNAVDKNKLVIDPFVMLDWVASWQNSFKEKGGGPFNAHQRHHFGSLLRAEAGVRFFETICFNKWNLVFEEKGAYARREPFKTGVVTATLIGAPGSFTVETLSTGQNLAVLELGAIFEPKDQSYPYGTIDYQAEFNGNYQSHQVTFEIAWNF